MIKRTDQLTQFLNKLDDFDDFMIGNGFELTIYVNFKDLL